MQAKCREHKDNMAEIISVLARASLSQPGPSMAILKARSGLWLWLRCLLPLLLPLLLPPPLLLLLRAASATNRTPPRADF
jgi:hypothetical protein